MAWIWVSGIIGLDERGRMAGDGRGRPGEGYGVADRGSTRAGEGEGMVASRGAEWRRVRSNRGSIGLGWGQDSGAFIDGVVATGGGGRGREGVWGAAKSCGRMGRGVR